MQNLYVIVCLFVLKMLCTDPVQRSAGAGWGSQSGGSMGCSDPGLCTLHPKVAGGARRTLSPRTPRLPGCRYGSPAPGHTNTQTVHLSGPMYSLTNRPEQRETKSGNLFPLRSHSLAWWVICIIQVYIFTPLLPFILKIIVKIVVKVAPRPQMSHLQRMDQTSRPPWSQFSLI